MNAINFFNYNIMDFKAENDTRTALKQLMKVYHETAHLRGGSRITGSLNTKVHYIEYSDEQETMIVICNTSGKKQDVKLPMKHQGHEMSDLLTGASVSLETIITLAPYEYKIYKH